jgi:cytochrome b pre-mRNA-processing protein 3
MWRQGKAQRELAARHYGETVRRAREPVFYDRFGVADTPDGRFDLLTLHAWLAVGRLGGPHSRLGRAYIDAVFGGFEQALREQGRDDLGLVRHLGRMAGAFYGRWKAYDEADGEAGLAAALLRNLYRGDETPQTATHAAALAAYALAVKARPWAGEQEALDFGPLPG